MTVFKLNKIGRNIKGRPEDPIMTDVLQHICDGLENMAEGKVYSINKMIKDKYGVGYCRWKEVGS